MSNLTKIVLISLGLNIALGLLVSLPLAFINDSDTSIGWAITILAIAALSLIVQLIIGIVLAVGNSNREIGKGMLISVGIILVIGLSVCSALIGGR